MIYLVRSAWSGCDSLILRGQKSDGDPCVDLDDFVEGLTPEFPRPKTSFVLSDPKDPRYQTVIQLRNRFGTLLHRAFVALTQEPADKDAADAVDASIQLVRALDIYLLEYAVSRDTLAAQKKFFTMTRDLIRTHPKQRNFPRLVWIKRATLYHYGRMHQHAYYRERSALDDQLMLDLVELSLSPYTRLRKHAQSTLISTSTYYRRGWRLTLPRIMEALERETAKGKDADPDRQKGEEDLSASLKVN